MTDDKRLKEIRKTFPPTNISDEEKPAPELLLSEIDRLKEENKQSKIIHGDFVESSKRMSGISESRIESLEAKLKEEEDKFEKALSFISDELGSESSEAVLTSILSSIRDKVVKK